MRWVVAVVTVAACYQPLSYSGGGSGSGSGSAGNAVDQLGVGARFACALDGSAQIACWGNNSFGQLGTGPAVVNAVGAPTVVAAPGPWTQLAVGAAHACGISGGSAYCWGDDTYDQLGGSATGALTAVPITGDIVQIAAGAMESCAIDSGSNLWCWGDVVGGDVTGSNAVEFGGTWSQVSVGYDHACGVVETATGSAVECWGTCADNECGSMTLTALYDFPSGAAAPARVFAGDRETCAIDVDGHLGCYGIDPNLPGWGVDSRVWTDLAIGPSANSNVDVLLRCGVTDGLAECWGEDALGGLGDGTWFHGIVSFTSPVTVGSADHVALGLPYAEQTDDFDEGGCLVAGSAVSCWGDNRSGELPALAVPVQGPTQVTAAGAMDWEQIASSSTHTCGLTTSDTGTQLYCWGQNDLAEVTGSVDDSRCPDGICDIPEPAPIAGDVTQLVVGEGFTCAQQGSMITCWGDNSHGQLGAPVTTHVSQLAGSGLVGGGFAACASLPTVECWGWFEPIGSAAMVGSDPSTTPLDPLGSASPVAIVFAADSQCADDGTNVECWGVDVQGELGDGSEGDTGNDPTPDVVLGNTGMTSLSGSFRHYCGVDANMNVECWGTSIDGESGPGNSGDNGTIQDRPQPIMSETTNDTLTNCTSLAVGQDYSCAVCDGTVVSCWGDALFGALGAGSEALAQPSFTEGVLIDVDPSYGIAGGGLRRANHTCSLSESDQLSCWGFGPRGELGTGSRGAASPIAVAVP